MNQPLHVAQRFGSDRPTEDIYNQSAATFQEGIIRSVDAEKWTCEVGTQAYAQILTDVRIMSPYYNFSNGHGIFQIPEVGTMCVVTRSQSGWFIVGFLPPSDLAATEDVGTENTTSNTQDLSQPFLGQVTAIQNSIQQQQPSEDRRPARHSFRSNREGNMIAGDGCVKTRAGNKIKWFTNGNILLEASKICQRIYSRLQNRIVDIAARYSLLTPGVQKEIAVDEENQQVLETIQVRKTTSDEKPSLQIRRGFVSSDEVYEFIVQENGSTKFRIVIKDDGEHLVTIGNPSSPAVKLESKPNGQYNVTGTVAIEVDAPSIIVGKTGEDLLVKFTAFEAKLNGHLHEFLDANGAPKITGTPTAPILVSSDATVKLKGG